MFSVMDGLCEHVWADGESGRQGGEDDLIFVPRLRALLRWGAKA